jgi:hypothetical protein
MATLKIAHFPGQRVDAGRLRRRFVLLDGEERHAEARSFDAKRHQHAADHEREREHHVDALIGELRVHRGLLAHHRQGHFLVAEPLEHVERGERVRQHGEREVVAAQPKSAEPDHDPRQHADDHAERNAEPGREAVFHEHDRHRVAAEPEEHRMAEGDQAAVPAQHVPREAHGGPQQHQRHDELVIGIADEESEQKIRPGKQRDP